MKTGLHRRPRATKRRRVQRPVQRRAPDRVAGRGAGREEVRPLPEGRGPAGDSPLHTTDLPIRQSPAQCRCGAPIIGQRCAHGHQAPKSRGLRYLHGGYAESSLESLDALGAIAEKRASLRAHHGGDQSVIETDLSADYCRYDVLIETVAANVARMGVLTARGRTRSSVGLLISLMRERQRLGTLLGLRPRAKEVSIADWLAEADGSNDPTTDDPGTDTTRGDTSRDDTDERSERNGEANTEQQHDDQQHGDD